MVLNVEPAPSAKNVATRAPKVADAVQSVRRVQSMPIAAKAHQSKPRALKGTWPSPPTRSRVRT